MFPCPRAPDKLWSKLVTIRKGKSLVDCGSNLASRTASPSAEITFVVQLPVSTVWKEFFTVL